MSEPLLKFLAESADFDSPIRRFDPSRPSHLKSRHNLRFLPRHSERHFPARSERMCLSRSHEGAVQ